MKRMKKIGALLLALVMVLSMAAGCGSKAAESAEQPKDAAGTKSEAADDTKSKAADNTASAGEKTKITAWMGSWWESEVPRLKAGFEEKYPEYELTIECLPINNYIEAAVTSILGGNAPDALALDGLMVATPVGQNLLQPLDDFMSRYGWEQDQFSPGAMKNGIMNDTVYAVPYRTAPNAMFYNKTLFDKAGLPYPTDNMPLDQFLETAEKLTNASEGVYGYGIAGSKNDPANVITSLGCFLWSKGGDFLTEDMTASAMDTAESVEGVKFWSELYTKYKVVPEGCINYAISADLIPMAQNGQLAMVPIDAVSASSMDEYAKKNGFEWDMCVAPGTEDRAAAWLWTIPAGAKNVDGAEKFIDYFLQPEVLADQDVVMPAVIEAQSIGVWTDPLYEAFWRADANAKKFPPLTPQWNEIQNIVITGLQNVLQGAATPEDACKSMSDEINGLLK
ncbi:sugar ABC transporter substrate-binding protein [Lachnospiraceae bacterium ASD3451]|uniref:ABC transporter substrate-binding protein n=1 Tax=Diplocloster agilis TaxID=2850323 RepID=UPI001D3A7DE8|nr:sugar ABC transporter substrate-binding protein [Diplocloster agilis]MBU9744952.1 sugar ABC transporter substrate-binding protein [Diplocloster agilis]